MDYVRGATEQAANVMSMDSMPCTSAQAMLPVTTQNIARSSAAMLPSEAVQSSAILSAMLGVFIIAAAAAYLLFARLETQEAQRRAALSGELRLLAFRLECCPLTCRQWYSLKAASLKAACYREVVRDFKMAAAAHIHFYIHQLDTQEALSVWHFLDAAHVPHRAHSDAGWLQEEPVAHAKALVHPRRQGWQSRRELGA